MNHYFKIFDSCVSKFAKSHFNEDQRFNLLLIIEKVFTSHVPTNKHSVT